MLSRHPAFHLSPYILPRDTQKRLRPNKPLTRTASCELISLLLDAKFNFGWTKCEVVILDIFVLSVAELTEDLKETNFRSVYG
jgi:hypothetical protein